MATLIVEDGTGLSNSNCYVSLADADQYHLDYEILAWNGSDDDKNSAILRAARYMDTLRWKGERAHKRAQAMDWPRYGATDCDGTLIPSDEVPVEVVRANIILAFYELNNQDGLSPEVTLAQVVEREKVDVIEVEYRGQAVSVDSARPFITGAMDEIRCLLLGGSGSFLKRA